MSSYTSIPRTFRPQCFKDVYEQEAVVQVLKNAILKNKTSHAYLFCGSRGSGKTTLARLFAKALNCKNLGADAEPCNTCSSCHEITSSSSLDVLEIDGASNRGIDDIRQLSENTIYAPSSSKYKIYIIDEVHMLTKEAFNALLKTLEEPPENVKFFFATTEPHKILPTVISRCQRFDLKRISMSSLFKKLEYISKSLSIDIEKEALLALCDVADGSLRDAESLLDQMLCFKQDRITFDDVAHLLGIVSSDLFFRLDQAILSYNLKESFSIANALYEEGKDLNLFIHKLIEHYQTILKLKLDVLDKSHIPEKQLKFLEESAKHFSKEKCLDICDYLLSQLEIFQQTPLKKSHLELIFLHLIRSSKAMSIEEITARLLNKTPTPSDNNEIATPINSPLPLETLKAVEETTPKKQHTTNPINELKQTSVSSETKEKNLQTTEVSTLEKPSQESINPKEIEKKSFTKPVQRYETLMRFAGVEFNGIVKKSS